MGGSTVTKVVVVIAQGDSRGVASVGVGVVVVSIVAERGAL